MSSHLTKYFLKPKEGEYVPITFIEFKQKIVGWSPELKKIIYVEKEKDTEGLKRVRKVNMMYVVNHLSGNLSSIELTDEEKAQFDEVYNSNFDEISHIVYTRKKIGKKMVSFFETHKNKRKAREVSSKNLMSEMM